MAIGLLNEMVPMDCQCLCRKSGMAGPHRHYLNRLGRIVPFPWRPSGQRDCVGGEMNNTERAEKISDDILAGWSLPGMSVGNQIKNGCLEGDLKEKIKAGLDEAVREARWEGTLTGRLEGFAAAQEKAAGIFKPGPHPNVPVQMTYEEAYERIRAMSFAT